MDLALLRTFVDVMLRGSFATVARDRNVDPSSISRAISALEDELGLRLFQRTTRRLSPTEAGLVYYERIAPLVDEMEEARLVAADVSERLRGTLRITTSVSFGQKCVVPLLPDFTARHPDLTIDLQLSDAIIDIVTERIDIAIRLGTLPDSTLIATQLLKARYLVCASPGYLARHGRPAAPRDLADHQCLLFPLPGFRTRWIFRDRAGALVDVPITGRILISNGIALQQCAVAGMGLALLPHWIVGPELQTGALVNVFPDYDVTATDFNTAAWILYPTRSYVPLKVRAFADFLKEEFRERPPWLRQTGPTGLR